MRKLTKIGIYSAVCLASLLLTEPARNYGALWDSQVHPVEAQVKLSDEQEISGLLFKSWDDRFHLTTTNGPDIEFGDFEHIHITTPVQNTGFFERWRTFMPTLLLTSLFMTAGMYLVGAVKQLLLSWRKLVPPTEGHS